jgi:hypothetical protein
MMYHALRGVGRLGDTCLDVDQFGDCTSWAVTPPVLNPVSGTPVIPTGLAPLSTVNLPGSAFLNPTTGNYTDYSNPLTPVGGTPSTAPTGSAATGFNWGTFFSGLIPSLAADATKIGQQAIATPGTVLLPNGTVAVGTAAGQAVSFIPGISQAQLTSMMPYVLIGGGLLVAVMMLKKGK